MMLPIELNRLAIRYETHTNAGLWLKAVMNEAIVPMIIGSKLHSLSRSGLGSIPGNKRSGYRADAAEGQI